MKDVNSQIPERNDKSDGRDPSNNELDERSLAFFGLDFQSADVRRGLLEVNLGPGAACEGVFDLATLAGMGTIRKHAGLSQARRQVRAVAQLGRAPASGAGGRGFESRQPD